MKLGFSCCPPRCIA